MPLPPKPPSRASALWVVLAAVAIFAAGAVIAVSLASANLANWGIWLRDFVQSSGVVAVAGLVAALIAFRGISKQVAVAQGALAQQYQTSQENIWWSMFEWAADRGIPRGKDEHPLPLAVVIDTLTKLADDATSDVQRAACSGMIDSLTRDVALDTASQESSSAAKPEAGSDSFPASDSEVLGDEPAEVSPTVQALSRYVSTTTGTAASSVAAAAFMYEQAVISALASMQASDMKVFRNPASADSGADAVVQVSGKLIAVVIKWTGSARAGANMMPRLVDRLRERSIADAFVVIMPAGPAVFSAREAELRTVFVTWNPDDSPAALVEALRRAAKLAR